MESAHPVLSPLTSLIQPLPPAWTALLATPPLALAPASWLTALPVLLASTLLLGSAPPVLHRSTSLPQLPPPAWTALLARSPLALALLCWLSALAAPVGPTSQAAQAPGPSPLAAVCVQWLTLMMVNPASKTQLGTMKPTRTAPSPSQGLAQ